VTGFKAWIERQIMYVELVGDHWEVPQVVSEKWGDENKPAFDLMALTQVIIRRREKKILV
jgi:hypothetical protein